MMQIAYVKGLFLYLLGNLCISGKLGVCLSFSEKLRDGFLSDFAILFSLLLLGL